MNIRNITRQTILGGILLSFFVILLYIFPAIILIATVFGLFISMSFFIGSMFDEIVSVMVSRFIDKNHNE